MTETLPLAGLWKPHMNGKKCQGTTLQLMEILAKAQTDEAL
jgi:hypothetical protein